MVRHCVRSPRSRRAVFRGRRMPSPHARGALREGVHPRRKPWAIPACAGSTSPPAAPTRRSRGHPRVRGEHGVAVDGVVDLLGPSPRARGAPGRDREGRGQAGTIPACAGSTSNTGGSQIDLGDHPRVRGEHRGVDAPVVCPMGPSPRARGARVHGGVAVDDLGTIPACAGSTAAARPRPWSPWDHPRVRGEHGAGRERQRSSPGPSPRARGARCGTRTATFVAGTIPACAGSTEPSSGRKAPPRDHPRVRGEHSQRPANLPAASSHFSNFFRNRLKNHRTQKNQKPTNHQKAVAPEDQTYRAPSPSARGTTTHHHSPFTQPESIAHPSPPLEAARVHAPTRDSGGSDRERWVAGVGAVRRTGADGVWT